MSAPIRFFRYSLPSIKHEGWAIILLDSSGMFAAVSDYGNYAFKWSHTGCEDFRDFVLEIGPDYTASKLYGRPDEVDVGRSAKHIRETLLQIRRRGSWNKQRARAEWELAAQLEEGEYDANAWMRETTFSDAYEYLLYRRPADVEAFVTKILPRLKEAIRAELAQERAAVEVRP